jgi:HJR/Mrr/RecB family endonuclease
MEFVKFDGLLKDILENYPSVDLVRFLQQRFSIPEYKAKLLAERIEGKFNLKMNYAVKEKSQELRTGDDAKEQDDNPAQINVYALDSLSGREFECFLKWLFEEMGFDVKLTKITADSGVDLVVAKEDQKIAVQAKRYRRNMKVSNSVVLKTHGGKDVYRCAKSIVVTTSYFTKQAIEDADKLNIELWDRDTLSAKIDRVNEEIRDSGQKAQFPKYKGSLLKSLLSLEKMGVFTIERKENGKHDIHRHGIKPPLLSFQARGPDVTRCVFRIKGKEPVGEYEGAVLIKSERQFIYGPGSERAYEKIIAYLSDFL